jgi:hypothetical protein
VTLLAALVRLYPSSCEARAMAAAMSYQHGARVEGVRLASRVLADAEQSRQQVAWARCAAMAAAAVNDASRAATWIARAASADDGIRMWGAVNGVLSGHAGLRQRIFPWGNVAEDREVVAAVTRLEAALGRARADAARILKGM